MIIVHGKISPPCLHLLKAFSSNQFLPLFFLNFGNRFALYLEIKLTEPIYLLWLNSATLSSLSKKRNKMLEFM